MTTFPEAIRLGFVNYVNFRGESTRSEYWFWALFAFLASLAANVVDYGIGVAMHGGVRNADSISIFGTIVGLGLLLPNLSAAVRRLRDAGKHWANIFWGIGANIIAYVFFIVALVLGVVSGLGVFSAAMGGNSNSDTGASLLGLIIVAGVIFLLGIAIALTGTIILIVKLCAPSAINPQAVPPTGNYSYYG